MMRGLLRNEIARGQSWDFFLFLIFIHNFYII